MEYYVPVTHPQGLSELNQAYFPIVPSAPRKMSELIMKLEIPDELHLFEQKDSTQDIVNI